MKRTRYDSEYDKVRAAAGMDRFAPEFPEVDRPAPQPQYRSRVRIDAALEEYRQQMATKEAQEAERRAETKAKLDKISLETSDLLRAAEYRAAGLSIPVINGVQTKASLGLLFSFGWSVQFVDGVRELVLPSAQKPRKRREDYDGNT